LPKRKKYAHVTFFFNGGVEAVYEGEDRILINSPKVATYDLKPEMSAYEVTDKVLECINKKEYDVIILNYANPDMVGHTGVFEAAKAAIEAIDECLHFSNNFLCFLYAGSTYLFYLFCVKLRAGFLVRVPDSV